MAYLGAENQGFFVEIGARGDLSGLGGQNRRRNGRKMPHEADIGCCQANANQSPKHPKSRRSGRQLTPLGQGSGAVLLEDFAAVEMAVVVEMVMDRGVGGSEFLQRFDVPKLGHRSLSSSERLV